MKNLIKQVPLFSNLSDKDLETITQHTKRRQFSKNTVILTEGDETNSLYIVKKGKVKAFLTSQTNREIILGIIAEGSYFGEVALLDGEPRSANVMTLEASEFFIIARDDFRQCLSENLNIAMNMLSGMAERSRDLTSNIKNLALSSVYRRMVNVFLKMAIDKEGVLVVEEKLTQQQIANLVGASREMVNKIIQDLIEGDYININKNKQITILRKLPSGW